MAPYPSLEHFYAADERRRRSPELDFGVWWRCGETVCRLTWVDDTGELIAVQLAGPTRGRVELNGELLELVRAGDELAVTVLAVVHERGVVERLLEGWAEVCGEPDSLAWVRGQLRTAGLEVAS